MLKKIFSLIIIVLALWVLNFYLKPISKIQAFINQGSEASQIQDEGFSYKDLNKNGQLDIYEDSRKSSIERSRDLLDKMTLEEKVGQMFHPPVMIKPDPMFRAFLEAMSDGISIEEFISVKYLSHFNFYGGASPKEIASRLNDLQKIAEKTRLGIPITFSTDPIHEVPRGGGIAAFSLDGFSKWPSQLGFAATRDTDLIYEFGKVAASEYRAVGFRTALHPMSDLATEPRWARNFGTFGSDADLSSKMTLAYMKGFQGDEINNKSVHTMVKHFPGGGPQKNGLDPHLKSGEDQVYPGENFDYHLKPFITAIDNGLKVIMPYYGIPVDQGNENVAMAYNKYILTDLLRDELNFEGVICTDWGIIEGRHWGVGDLSISQRYEKSINAGVDQYGGENKPEYIIDLVKNGNISENRIDESVLRILINKFDLGIFENTYVDESLIDEIVNSDAYVKKGFEAQLKSIVLLTNKESTLPLNNKIKVYVDGMKVDSVDDYAEVVDNPEDADYILYFINTVFNGNQESGIDRMIDNLLSTRFPNSDLAYDEDIMNKIFEYSSISKLITIVDLNRPAILTDVNSKSSALVGTFGVSDKSILEVLFGNFNPSGKLPFEIPSSMEEVQNQKEDLPDDTKNPVFVYGHGLSY